MIEIGPRRRGQHDAGPVIVGKHHVPLDRAGGDHHLLGPHLPEPLPRQRRIGIGEVLGHTLDQANVVLRLVSERRGAGQHPHIIHRAKLCRNRPAPSPSPAAVHSRIGFVMKRAAGFGLLVAQDHLRTGMGCRKGCRQAGRTAADHQHIAMGEMVGIMVRIRFARSHAEAGRSADYRFVDLLPGGLRPHEGLVVKPAAKNGDARLLSPPTSKASDGQRFCDLGLQPVIDLLHGGPDIRCPPYRIAADVHQRIGLFRAC
jgi:hypothetical protein